MVQPRLLHPILVKVFQKNTTKTLVEDKLLKQVLGTVGRDTSINIYGQIQEDLSQAAMMRYGAKAQEASGYILFRHLDMQALGILITEGDRIYEVGEGVNKREVDWYVVHVKNEGHYQYQRGATLLKAFFKDREPTHRR